jgi:hypothetical protein
MNLRASFAACGRFERGREVDWDQRFKDWAHPKRLAWRDRMDAPVVGSKRRRMNPGCYGICCGEGTRGRRLCTVCRKYGAAKTCCGHFTVFVNARIRVPRSTAHSRWKEFIRRFPGFAYDEGLRAVSCGLCGEEYAAKHANHHAANSVRHAAAASV